jgi:hypothetical protein
MTLASNTRLACIDLIGDLSTPSKRVSQYDALRRPCHGEDEVPSSARGQCTPEASTEHILGFAGLRNYSDARSAHQTWQTGNNGRPAGQLGQINLSSAHCTSFFRTFIDTRHSHQSLGMPAIEDLSITNLRRFQVPHHGATLVLRDRRRGTRQMTSRTT